MADDRDATGAPAPLCPMCRRPLVTPGPATERGVHAGCDLGLADAGTAIARLLQEHPGHGLCLPCIGRALAITPREAEVGAARLRPLRGFEVRFEACVGCGGRGHVVRALRADLRPSSRRSRLA